MQIYGLVAGALLLIPAAALAVEEAEYEVVERSGDLELRDYSAHIVAEVVVDESMEDAGNAAFRTLYRYISGNNTSKQKIAMTAPVGQRPGGEKIAMTAPVGQRPQGEAWAVSFMMPAGYTLETLPEPNDPAVKLREVPARRMAAIEYSGLWSEKNYREHKERLEQWISEKGLRTAGPVEWARYDPPFKPWFLRRNEVLIPVERSN